MSLWIQSVTHLLPRCHRFRLFIHESLPSTAHAAARQMLVDLPVHLLVHLLQQITLRGARCVVVFESFLNLNLRVTS